METTWEVQIISKDASGVVCMAPNGDEQYLSWDEWKLFRENRRKIEGSDYPHS